MSEFDTMYPNMSIAEALRAHSPGGCYGCTVLRRAAAEEIERLMKERDEACGKLSAMHEAAIESTVLPE
jgi:Fe-S cluster biogenesis protein NfuA